MAIQSLTTDVRNPVLGRIGDPASMDLPGIEHLSDLMPTAALPSVQGLATPTSDMSGLPALPAPIAPLVSGPSALDIRKKSIEDDLQRRITPTQPTSVLGKIGHGLATAGNILGDIFAPSTMALIPGTQLNNAALEQRDKSDLAGISDLENQETQRKATEAQTAYTEQRPEIEKAKILQKLTSALAPHGIVASMNPDGTIDTQDDPNSEAYKSRVAVDTLKNAQADREQILASMGKPGTPLYDQKQRQLDQVDERIKIGLAGLGLRRADLGVQQQRVGIEGERLGFDEDKNYNPEPTAQERGKGDLASSAVHQIQVMRDVVNRRKDQFGPAAGSGTAFQTWLGSEDPDAAAYNAAQTYLAEHSAGVFGGRGEYILKGLHALTNQRQNPAALNSMLNEAEGTAQHFVNAGTVHGKGQAGFAAGNPKPQGDTPKVKVFNVKTGRLE